MFSTGVLSYSFAWNILLCHLILFNFLSFFVFKCVFFSLPGLNVCFVKEHFPCRLHVLGSFGRLAGVGAGVGLGSVVPGCFAPRPPWWNSWSWSGHGLVGPRSCHAGQPRQDGWSKGGCGMGGPMVLFTWVILVGWLELGQLHQGCLRSMTVAGGLGCTGTALADWLEHLDYFPTMVIR